MNIPVKLSSYLKEKRAASGLSQMAVSRLLGYPNQQSVNNWERGVASPPIKKLKKLIKIYGISKDEFMSAFLDEIDRAVRPRL
jgi:transcriptional regulator with XRE-family HTH domain